MPIVIADDSSMSRKLVRRALPPEWEVEITEAENGAQAMEACRQNKGHVLFLDLTMPVMDGFEVLEAIQKECLHSLVIVISADIQPQAQVRVRAAGALGFIKKPVDADRLGAVLREFGIL